MSLKNPDFKYRPSFATDIRKTFARIKSEQKKAEKAAADDKQQPLQLECDVLALVPAPFRWNQKRTGT